MEFENTNASINPFSYLYFPHLMATVALAYYSRNKNNKTRLFDLKWIVLDNSEAIKKFKWKIKFSKHQIFEDININDD